MRLDCPPPHLAVCFWGGGRGLTRGLWLSQEAARQKLDFATQKKDKAGLRRTGVVSSPHGENQPGWGRAVPHATVPWRQRATSSSEGRRDSGDQESLRLERRGRLGEGRGRGAVTGGAALGGGLCAAAASPPPCSRGKGQLGAPRCISTATASLSLGVSHVYSMHFLYKKKIRETAS